MFIAGTSLEWRNAAWKRRLAVALLALFAVRMAVVATHWQAADRVYAEYLAAFEALPVGSRLLPAYARRSSDMRSDFDPPIDQIAALAVITRSAFVPTMYALRWAQTISAVAPNRPPHYLHTPLLGWVFGGAPGHALSWAASTQPANIAYLREELAELRLSPRAERQGPRESRAHGADERISGRQLRALQDRRREPRLTAAARRAGALGASLTFKPPRRAAPPPARFPRLEAIPPSC